MLVIASGCLFFLGYLLLEIHLHSRRRRMIPLCIAVTGTRGKSGVVRLLAAVLRAGGRTVLAKTTGSRPVLILPDGREQPIRRRGVPSIIEQKRLVREAGQRGVEVLVAEIMSLHPECHRIEAQMLLRPDIVLLTNVRRDHLEAMGGTEEAIAATLALDVPPGATLFVPAAEAREVFRRTVAGSGGRLIEVPAGTSACLEPGKAGPACYEFAENLDLVCALAEELGFDRGTVRRGFEQASPDLGALGIWRLAAACEPVKDPAGGPAAGPKHIWLVNAFAANDPDSTARVLDRVRTLLPPARTSVTGLLALRPDRGERTVQWVEALRGGLRDTFSELHLCGLHARAVRSRLGRGRLLAPGDPAGMTAAVGRTMADGDILFGFGNIGGPGEALVEYWRRVGEPYQAVISGTAEPVTMSSDPASSGASGASGDEEVAHGI